MGIISLQWHKSTLCLKSRSSSREVFTEIMFAEIIQNYGKKTVLESLFLIKLQVGGGQQPYLQRLRHRCFALNFVKF